LQKNQSGYLQRTSGLDFVGAAFSRDRFNSRLKAAPTSVFFVIWTYRISVKNRLNAAKRKTRWPPLVIPVQAGRPHRMPLPGTRLRWSDGPR